MARLTMQRDALPVHLSRVLKMFLKHKEKRELKELSECTFSLRQHFQYIYQSNKYLYNLKSIML